MYAILESGSEQFRVEEGDTLTIPKIDAEAGEKRTFDKILLLNDGQETKIGMPYVEGASVTAEVLGATLGKKVNIFKMRRRATYRLHRGHRQQYTKVRIDKINASG
jgi:large subunit ribosomal protein L21